MASTIKDLLNQANPNELPARMQQAEVGTVLEGIARRGGSSGAPTTSGWSASVAVAANTATLTTAGLIVAVEATTGTVTGPCGQRSTAPAVTRDVQVTYDDDGLPTLTFLGADAVTACVVKQITTKSGLGRDLATEA